MRSRIREVFDSDDAPSEPRQRDENKYKEQIIATFPRPQAGKVSKFLDALLSKTGNVFPRVFTLVEAVLDAQPEDAYKFIEQMDNIYRHLSPRGISELTDILEWFKVAPSLLYEKVMIMKNCYEDADGRLHEWYSSKPKEKERDLFYNRGSRNRNGSVYRVASQRRTNKSLDT